MKKMLTLFFIALCVNCTAQQTTQMPVKSNYALASSLLIGTNVAFTLINVSPYYTKVKGISNLGMITGMAEIIVGALNIDQDKEIQVNGSTVLASYKAQNNLSYFNIAIGTATFVTSAINLFLNNNSK